MGGQATEGAPKLLAVSAGSMKAKKEMGCSSNLVVLRGNAHPTAREILGRKHAGVPRKVFEGYRQELGGETKERRELLPQTEGDFATAKETHSSH